MPYDIRRFKQELKNKFIQLFEDNFAKFLIKFNLVPCAKKKCKSFPLYQSGFQCICLICLKKMCSKNCGHIQEVQIGNLSRHSQKKHMSKSLFLNINNSKIYVMQAPLIVICNLTLFQNLTGEQPWHDPYQQQHYMSFKLNFKAVNWIVDVLIGYKYLNKIFADIVKQIILNLIQLYDTNINFYSVNIYQNSIIIKIQNIQSQFFPKNQKKILAHIKIHAFFIGTFTFLTKYFKM